MLWDLLAEFIFRLAFGIAMAMLWTSSNDVTCGFFRVHSWVLLGLNTFSVLAALSRDHLGDVWPLALAAAIFGYLSSVAWLYESRTLGKLALAAVAIANFVAAILVIGPTESWLTLAMAVGDVATSGMLLGLTMTAMLLGHWYLNTPTMKLLPLQRMIQQLWICVGLRAVLCGVGLVVAVLAMDSVEFGWMGLVSLRWLAGFFGIALLSGMTWQTLKIPNTQSATGILYVAVIFSFIGELTSQLLSSETAFPL